MKKSVFTKSVTFSLNQHAFDVIKKITDKEEISLSEWIREAIIRRFEQENLDQNQSETSNG